MLPSRSRQDLAVPPVRDLALRVPRIGVLWLLPLLVSCSGDPWSRWMGEPGAEMPVGIAAEELPEAGSPDAELVAIYCSTCHGIPSPAMHAAEDWPATERRMFRRMEHMASMGRMMGRMHRGVETGAPTRGEQHRMLAYLQRHALRALPAESFSPGDPAAAEFAAACSRCHALPDPSQHAASEWPSVVARMRQHMDEMGVTPINDRQASLIVEFLQRRAADAAPPPVPVGPNPRIP